MKQAKNYITREGFEKLQAEYRRLFHEERPRLVETVAWAAGNGDRSENADYIYGKRRLHEIDRRLRFLQGRMDAAEVVDPANLQADKVIFGAFVTVVDEDEREQIYQIVGEDETDAGRKRISWCSPLGKALLGRRVGDEIRFRRPSGEIYLEIKDIWFK